MMDRAIFVKVDKYDEVVSAVEVIRKKLNEAKTTLDKINELKSREDAELDRWSSELSNVESKIDAIENMLSEGM